MADRDEKGYFQKGNQIAKGKGRPKESISINDELRKLLANKSKDSKKKYVEIFAQKIFADALKGNDRLLVELWQQLEGRPRQAVDVGGQEDNPLKHELTIVNASQVINNKPKKVDEED